MELYILDSLYRPITVVDSFESLIWTERLSSIGDFELHMISTLENRTKFNIGQLVAINTSYRVMEIETIEESNNTDGSETIIIKGRSIEKILDSRLAMGVLGDTTENPKWVLTGTPKVIANKIFHDICVTGILSAGDIIPSIIEDSIFPVDTIAEPTETITYEINIATVYAALKELCDVYGMGFRFVRDPVTYQRYFDVYMGSDRTTAQSTLPAVVFSQDLDNLTKTTKLQSNALYKNVAYVLSPVGYQIVYDPDIDSSVNGFERRVIVVKADDIRDEIPEDAAAKMIQRGKQELAKARPFTSFDGELAQNNKYRYGIDYNLGDLVEFQNEDDVTLMQVTEQIMVSDSQGERAYPTLSINQYVMPGTWLAWDYNQVWEDVGDTEYWADQP